jgi:hypothetical protein
MPVNRTVLAQASEVGERIVKLGGVVEEDVRDRVPRGEAALDCHGFEPP